MQSTSPGPAARLSESLEDRAERAEESRTCLCGNSKKPGVHFCLECWHALAKRLRAAYGRVSGRTPMAQWYDEARSYLLEETTRVRR